MEQPTTTGPTGGPPALREFLRVHREQLLAQWTAQARGASELLPSLYDALISGEGFPRLEQELDLRGVLAVYGALRAVLLAAGFPVEPVCALIDRATVLAAERLALRRERTFTRLFSALMHDLKTPLSTIRGMAQLTHDQLERSGEMRFADRMAKIERQTLRLNHILSEFMDLRLLEEGKLPLDLRPVDYLPLLNAVAEEWRAASDAHPIVVEAEGLGVLADRQRLLQVLSTLLDNAIRYSPHGGEIRITARRIGGEVVTAIEDHGVGIRPEELEGIWTLRRHRLGLFAASALMRAQGGRIWVRSSLGEGSTFSFTLPAAGAPQ